MVKISIFTPLLIPLEVRLLVTRTNLDGAKVFYIKVDEQTDCTRSIDEERVSKMQTTNTHAKPPVPTNSSIVFRDQSGLYNAINPYQIWKVRNVSKYTTAIEC